METKTTTSPLEKTSTNTLIGSRKSLSGIIWERSLLHGRAKQTRSSCKYILSCLLAWRGCSNYQPVCGCMVLCLVTTKLWAIINVRNDFNFLQCAANCRAHMHSANFHFLHNPQLIFQLFKKMQEFSHFL